MFLSTLCTLKTNLSALCMTLCLIEAERINMAISTTPCITQAVGCPESPPVYQHCVKCGVRAGCFSRSVADSAMPRGVTALCSCSVFPLAPAHAQLALHVLSVWVGLRFLLLHVSFVSDHAYRMSHLAKHMKSSFGLFTAAVVRENGHCHWHPAIWRKSGCCRARRCKDAKESRSHLLSFLHVCRVQTQKPSSQS